MSMHARTLLLYPHRCANKAAQSKRDSIRLSLFLVLVVHLGSGVSSLRAPAAETPAAPPQAKDELRRDRYGDPLPPGAIARLGTLRFRYEGPAEEGLVYSPDGKILAGLFSRGIILWDAQSGRELRRLAVKTSGIGSRPFDFSPDGTTLAALDITSRIHFWDVATGRLLRIVPAPKAAHYQGDILRYSPDGKQLALCWREDCVYLLDAATGKGLRQFRMDRRQVTDFSIASNGKILALTSTHPSVSLWELSTGKQIRAIDVGPKGKSTFSIAFTRDGKAIAVGCWDFIVVADTATGKEIARFEAKCEAVTGLVFALDGQILFSCSQDGKLRLWDLSAKKLRATLENRHRSGRCLALSPDGKTVAMGTGGSFVHLWDVASRKELFTQYEGPDSRIRAVVFSPDGRTLFSCEENGRVHVWDSASWRENHAFAGGRDLALSPDGRVLAWCDHTHTMHLRDAGTDNDRREWLIPGKDHLLGPVFAGTADRLVTTDHKRGEPTPTNPVQWGKARLVVWDATTGKMRHEIALPSFVPGCLAVSSDGSNAYLGGSMPEPAILVCDLERGLMAPSLLGHEHIISALALSANGRLLASAGLDQSLRLWETATAKAIRVWPKQPAVMAALAFSPDGRILASADGSPPMFGYDVPDRPRIRLWDVASGQEIARREGHQAHVRALTFSPDGKRLASVQGDSTVLIWDVSSLANAVSRGSIDSDLTTPTTAWNDLANVDARKGQQAIWNFVAVPHRAVPLLHERLRPVKVIESERIRQWIAALDSDNFATREAAVENLNAADRQAERALMRALKEKPSLEARRRVEAVLERLRGPVTRPELLQSLRAVAVLEDIGTPEARRLLEELAKGALEARLTREARESLRRLDLRNVSAHNTQGGK